ncbi:putative RNA-directed DNA polymerase from transposon X-element [Trichonephila clavipes]|nr:putative RNA-directed DNA polymerase from transposon X-element [Trichonephila clavipes]
MAHNKQLKVVLRGLPTDFDQEEHMTELHAIGFNPNHISLLRNRKTNTNMPLFLVTLPKCPESKGIFNIKTIGFFRVAAEPSINPPCLISVIAVRSFFITLGSALDHRSASNVQVAISPQNAQSQPRPRQSVQIAAARTQQTSRVAPRIPSTPNPTRTNRPRTSEELKECIIDYDPNIIGKQETHLRPADRIGNNSKTTVACIYRPPHGSIKTTELDAILNHSNKAFLFGDFNAKHPSWNPDRANTNGNILCNWAVGSPLDILAPTLLRISALTTPTLSLT